MRILVLILLLLAAYFSLTAFVPSPVDKAMMYWPWAIDSRSWIKFVGVPQSGPTVILAGIAGAAFLGAAASVLGWIVPAGWFRMSVLVGVVASFALFVSYLSPLAILPIVVDAVLVWGVLVQNWTPTSLGGL